MFFMKIKLNLFYEDNAETSGTFIYCLTKCTPCARCHGCYNVTFDQNGQKGKHFKR